MDSFVEFLILFLSQFAGGPGSFENNLMRFGLPAIMWAVLLVVAWSRQRESERPRERWLVWGFGLALARDLFMLVFISLQVSGVVERHSAYFISAPLEQALTMASIVVIAGAFLRYILDDTHVARRYLRVGLLVTLVCYAATFGWWFSYSRANPEVRFGLTWASGFFHLVSAVLIVGAMFTIYRTKGWLRNVMMLALSIFLVSDLLMLVSLATGDISIHVFSHSLQILAIPLLGYIYIREQAVEREDAISALSDNEQRLREIIDHTQAGYYFMDREGYYRQVNQAWLQMHGYETASEILGRHYSITQPESIARGLHDDINGQIKGELIAPNESRRMTKDGSLKYHTASSVPVIQSGQVIGLEGFLIDRTKQVHAETEIQRRMEQMAVLQELDRLRSELIANVSHDLRTPLGLIKLSSTSLMAKDVEFPADMRMEMLGVILDESERLEKIVDDLLLLAQAESGRLKIKKRPMPAQAIIEQAISGLDVATKEHQIIYDVDPPSLTINLDPDRIELVLRNLLGNALKYSPDGGIIRVEAYTEGNEALLSVADQGIGIPGEELERVFDRFYRLDNAVTRQVRGAGLGLAVCRNMVRAHDGRIWVRSLPGEGSTFYVSIPLDNGQEIRSDYLEVVRA